jgi:alpha-beta hydrolase superfamily lysophospholipase
MKHTVGAFEGTGGISLASYCWMPKESPRALIVIVHGVTEHCARYSAIVRPFLAAQVGVCGFDLRGHGHSSGHPGHVDRWQDYSSDLDLFLRTVRTAHPAIPVFLFGHSLGSLIVLSYVMEHPGTITGVIVCGAAIEPVGVARPHLVALARAFSFLWPRFPIAVRTKGRNALSRDPRVEAAFLADPLVVKSVTARFGTEALAMIAAVKRSAHSINLPLLVIHGGADPLNSVTGARQFFHEVSSADKRMIVYAGCYHEPHNDLDRDKVLADLRDWIENHV